MRRGISLLVALLMVCSMTLGASAVDYTIPEGQPTAVDGDLSDWADANWIAMNEVIWAEDNAPYDLSEAKWAAKWSSAANLIYLAVTGVDTQHYFAPGNTAIWNAADQIEFFIDAGDTNEANYSYSWGNNWAHAQQYCGGLKSAVVGGGEWCTLAGQPDPPNEAINSGILAGFKVGVDGDRLSYEVAIRPYAEFDINDPAGSTLVTLASGMQIGFDVVMSSKAIDNFGQLCENLLDPKWSHAENFQTYTLVSGVSLLPGDANGDGMVDVGDLGILAGNYGTTSGATWAMGDFNKDGAVDVGDLGILAGNYGKGIPIIVEPVPEPATLLVLVGGSLLAGLKRKA